MPTGTLPSLRSGHFDLVASDLEDHSYVEDGDEAGLVRFATYRNKSVVVLDGRMSLEELVRSALGQGVPESALPNSIQKLGA